MPRTKQHSLRVKQEANEDGQARRLGFSFSHGMPYCSDAVINAVVWRLGKCGKCGRSDSGDSIWRIIWSVGQTQEMIVIVVRRWLNYSPPHLLVHQRLRCLRRTRSSGHSPISTKASSRIKKTRAPIVTSKKGPIHASSILIGSSGNPTPI